MFLIQDQKFTLNFRLPSCRGLQWSAHFGVFAREQDGFVRWCRFACGVPFWACLRVHLLSVFRGCARLGACVTVYLSETARRGDPSLAGKKTPSGSDTSCSSLGELTFPPHANLVLLYNVVLPVLLVGISSIPSHHIKVGGDIWEYYYTIH